MHERLVADGFAVISYDRLGVGMSDANMSGVAPSAADVVKEMQCVIDVILPSSTKIILLGPSMGSIVAQCYIAKNPGKVAGFCNFDGLPCKF